MLSAPLDADLLDRDSWTMSERLGRNPDWLDGRFGGWLEGNAVVTPQGHIVNVLRVSDEAVGDIAAVIAYSDDGKTPRFTDANRAFGDDPASAEKILTQGGFIPLPGANTKFLIREDPQKPGTYWMLSNATPPKHHHGNLGGIRNTLSLFHSDDLVHWKLRTRLLYHPDVVNHAFQYPDWVYDGDDLAVVLRTAYDDGMGGPHNFHDANFITFLRVSNFRELTEKDSVEIGELPAQMMESSVLSVSGTNIEPGILKNGERAFSNRAYVWGDVPQKLAGARYTRTGGGVAATLKVKAKEDTDVYAATAPSVEGKSDLTGWKAVPGMFFTYNDGSKTRMDVYRKSLKAGEEVEVPQGSWQGMIVILPGE